MYMKRSTNDSPGTQRSQNDARQSSRLVAGLGSPSAKQQDIVSPGMSFAKLPVELLRKILDHATDNPLRHEEYHYLLTCSTTSGEKNKEKELDDALKSKAALRRVSRTFKSVLDDGFAYENIRVRQGSDSPAALLEASQERRNDSQLHRPCHALGCRVRRICLYPEDGHIAATWAGTVNRYAYRILRCCPHVEVRDSAFAALEIITSQDSKCLTQNSLKSPLRMTYNSRPYVASTGPRSRIWARQIFREGACHFLASSGSCLLSKSPV